MTLEENDPRRIFEGQALIKRMERIGVLKKEETQLDYVLGLTTQQFLERRLQTIIFQSKNASSIHQARSLIFQKKIAIYKGNRRQVINIPSFIVRKENEPIIVKITGKEDFDSRTKRRTKKRNEEKSDKDAQEE